MIETNTSLGVFVGEQAARHFLNPEYHTPVPLVEIPTELNPFRDHGVRIFCKMMSLLPLGNVKSLPAINMLESAHEKGHIAAGSKIVESSSGNTVFSLAMAARAFGAASTKSYCSHEVRRGKLDLLRFAGISIEVQRESICPDPSDPLSGINRARAEGLTAGVFNPGQYDNRDNPSAHERWTGPQLWKQLNGQIDILCAGLGTTGTIVGTSQYLKKHNPKLTSIGVVRSPNNPVPGVRTNGLLREVSFPWQEAIDIEVEIGTIQAFERSLHLCRAGLLVGPSAGFALAGLLTHLETLVHHGAIDHNSNQREIHAVFIAPDGPLPYLHEYFEVLPAELFPPIINEHLLLDAMPNPSVYRSQEVAPELTLSCEKLTTEINQASINSNEPLVIIDIRPSYLYQDHHIPGSISVNAETLRVIIEKTPEALINKQIVIVCEHGIQSLSLAHEAYKNNLIIYSLSGGTREWSRRNLPRVQPQSCIPTSSVQEEVSQNHVQ